MTAIEDRSDEFLPPTALESAARALGADTVRYRADYVMLPMRDGVRLATVVFRPRAEGRYPAMLVRSPYSASIPDQFKPLHTAQFKKNYVLVMQNERGSEWSEGDFGFLTTTTADAQDTLDWISGREWSNGKVGMHGCSSTAENQLKLGAIGHPALRACVPMSSGAGVGDVPGAEGSNGCFFRGGVPMIKTWALWYGPYGVRLRPKLPADAEGDELARIFRQYSVAVPDFRLPEYAAALDRATLQPPSGEILRRLGSPLTGYEIFMADGPTSPAWKKIDLIDASHTGATPSININGWMDVGAYETVKLFEFQQHHPDQYLIMAPTQHCRMLVTSPEAKLGDRPMGDTRFPYDEIITSWFDRFLLDEAEAGSPADADETSKAGGTADAAGAWRPMPRVQVFLMGAGTWLTGDSWPLPETEPRSLFLTSEMGANTLWGDGALVAVARDGADDEFIADPHNPVQSIGGDLGTHGPVCADQRVVECRADVLVYSTPALAEPVAIAGDVTAELYVSADVEDADVFIKLVDVYPDGTAYNLAESALRLCYRDGFGQPSRLVPGEVYRVTIGGITTANYFPAGHQIRLEVTGSNFPLADRNWHTGDRNDLATDGPVAHITLHHGEGHESALHFRSYTGEITVGTPMSDTRAPQ
jgi:putative CocE/NonD family hydrolase